MQLELRHLRYFVAVAEELNFTRAAERLHVAQPALSAQIRQLETQLGCELLIRTTRKVELTPAGALLLEDAARIVADADAAVARVMAAARGHRGVLRICFVAHGAGEIGTEILRRFRDTNPQVETETIESGSLEEIQRQVRDHEADLGFVWLPILYDELDVEIAARERKLACMHAEHLLASKRAVTASDLVDEPIVAPWELYPRAMLDYWFTPFRPNGRKSEDPQGRSLEECLGFVIRGDAIFCVPESVERFYPRAELVFRPIVDVAPAEVGVGWRRDTRNPAVHSFVQVVREIVREEPAAPIPIQKQSS